MFQVTWFFNQSEYVILAKSSFFKKWANPGLVLFIFILFKHKLCIKTVGISGIWTRIVGVEGEHADHLTITSAQCSYDMLKFVYNIDACIGWRRCR